MIKFKFEETPSKVITLSKNHCLERDKKHNGVVSSWWSLLDDYFVLILQNWDGCDIRTNFQQDCATAHMATMSMNKVKLGLVEYRGHEDQLIYLLVTFVWAFLKSRAYNNTLKTIDILKTIFVTKSRQSLQSGSAGFCDNGSDGTSACLWWKGRHLEGVTF